MGAVLAMTVSAKRMRRHGIRAGALALVLFGLTACSSEGESVLLQSARNLGTVFTKTDRSAFDARAALSPAMVAAVTQPYLLVEVPWRQASATMNIVSQRRGVQDWRGEDQISIILQDDVLISTRGFGPDLFGADPLPSGALRAARLTPYMRSFRYMDGENRLIVNTYRCALSAAGTEPVDLIDRQVETRRINETCHDLERAGIGITNSYWLGTEDNQVWKSKQWVSESVAEVTLYHLVR